MDKHTPGPWEWDSGMVPPDGPGRYSDIYVEGGDKIIAEVNEFLEISPEEGRANALLIKAAPDLLNALRELHEMYAHVWDRVDGALVIFDRRSIEKFEKAHEQARMVLAKVGTDS